MNKYEISAVKDNMCGIFKSAINKIETLEERKDIASSLKRSKDYFLMLWNLLGQEGYSSALDFEVPGTEMFKKTGVHPESIYLAKMRIYGLLGEFTDDMDRRLNYFVEAVNATKKLLINKKGEFVEEYQVRDILEDSVVDAEQIFAEVLPRYKECLMKCNKDGELAEEIWWFLATLPPHISSEYDVNKILDEDAERFRKSPSPKES